MVAGQRSSNVSCLVHGNHWAEGERKEALYTSSIVTVLNASFKVGVGVAGS